MGIDDNQYERLMLKYKLTLEKLQTEMNIQIQQYEFENNYQPVDHIKTRIKTRESALSKLERKGYEVNLYNLQYHIHDMVGMRIVCSFLSDVYEVVHMIERSKFIVIKEKKDYIANPKDTGYSSYHLKVLIPMYLNGVAEYVEAEIQIRTLAMDFWASLDHKIQYKFSGIPDSVRQEMYNCSVAIKALDNKMLYLQRLADEHKED